MNNIVQHIDEMRILLERKSIDILAINESKIHHTVLASEIYNCGYNIIRNDRNRNGGGVIMYLKQLLSFTERNDLVVDSLEMICVEIKKPYNKSFLVCAWYGPPNSNINLHDDVEVSLHKCDILQIKS